MHALELPGDGLHRPGDGPAALLGIGGALAAIVSTRGRNGTVVEASGNDVGRHLGAAASGFAEEAARWGVDEDTAVEYVRAAFRTTGFSPW